jgi:GTP-binding protein Era
MSEPQYQCGFIALIGRPNVGKSTLLNTLVGEKLAIVTPKPQTTRTRLTGVKTLPQAQLIFVDTPGIHTHTGSLLNRHMVELALGAVQETDMVLFLVDGQRGIVDGDEKIAARLSALSTPVIGVVNKIDLVPRPALLPVLERLAGLLPEREIIPVSALHDTNTAELLSTLIQPLPVGPALYPSDELTDQSERLLAQEMIREQLFFHTQQEIPYATAAVVEEFTERADKSLLIIRAAIHVERVSQKVIVIGKGGTQLKKIGQAARRRMEAFFGCKVFLELFVKVSKGWTNRPGMLQELGLS